MFAGIVAYKFFKKISRGVCEIIPQYELMIGFGSNSKAKRRARELENGGVK